MFLLSGGALLGQALIVLVAPALTRLYQPDELGRLGVFSAFVSLAVVATSLRYEMAIVTASGVAEATRLATLCALLVIPLSLICTGALFLFIRGSILGMETLPIHAVAFCLPALVIASAFNILRSWFVRLESFALISGGVIAQNGGRAFAQLGFGLVTGGWVALFAGDVLGRAMGMFTMLYRAWPTLREQFGFLNWDSVRQTARIHAHYPVYSMPSSVIDALAASLALPLVASTYGAAAAGQFALVQRVVALPVSFVVLSVADAFHARMAAHMRARPAHVQRFFWLVAGALALVGVVPTTVLMIWGEPLFAIAFGPTWREGGTLAALSAPAAFTQLVVSPLSRVIFIYSRQRLKFVYDVLSLIAVVAPLYAADVLHLSLYAAVLWLSISQVVSRLVYFAILTNVIRKAG